MSKENFASKASLVWNIADLLRGGWKQYEYQDVVLPLVVLKRLDALLAVTKEKVLEQHNAFEGKVDTDPVLKALTGVGFYNTSPFDFEKLLEDPASIGDNFRHFLGGFSENIRDIFAKFEFDKQLERLEGGNLLYLVIKELNKVELHPKAVDNHEMGSIFEELIRKFAEQSNETAGEHYTPREVIKLMVEVLFAPDAKELQKPHVIKTVYDCACGTGGMLSVAKDHVRDSMNEKANLYLFGQELNPVSYAMCKSDMLIKGENPENIKGGEKDHSKASTLSNDQLFGQQFDYMLTNPPFGVDWKKDKEVVEREAERGYAGRFGAGLPRISDGQLLFLQHLIFKMRRVEDGGSRIAIVFNGSPLFTGDAGSGESEIRRSILEKDLLETIIALPDQLFFNTGISTYVWVLSNRKSEERAGKVQLIDARELFTKKRKSLGNKRNEISDENRDAIVKMYEGFADKQSSKVFSTTDFAYRQIVIERPLRLSFHMSEENIAAASAALGVDTTIAAQRVKDAGARQKKTKATVLSRAAEAASEKAAEQLEIQLNIVAALRSLKGKRWTDRAKFIADIEEALSLEQGVRPAKKPLQIIVKAVGVRDSVAEVCVDEDGNPEPDSELRDTENVPWGTDVFVYFENEVKPFVADAWVNETVRDHKDNGIGKVGYEIPFTRYFYNYQSPRAVEVITAEILKIEKELQALLTAL